MSIKNHVKRHLLNIPGWHTGRKIVVIESDDWGSIRMPNRESLQMLRDQGIAVENCQYMLNDALETDEDMESLFFIIRKMKKKPVITANFLTSNPDFEKIADHNFSEYFHEPITATLARNSQNKNVFNYYLEGMRENFFIPQLHGREHLNISRWMADLKTGNEETLLAFKLRTFGVSGHVVKQTRGSYQAAFDCGKDNYPTDHSVIIEEAVKQFKEMFDFSPITFIAPNYVWGEEVEKATAKMGIKYLQGTNTQKLPEKEHGKRLKKNFLGNENKFGQKYLIRNCSFEPFSQPNKDWVKSCMEEIATSFLWRKPAVISMHRVNFVGSINPSNREKNLETFTALIKNIIKKWPDVEFMSSDQLAKLI